MAPAPVLLLHSDSDDREMYTDYLREHGFVVIVVGNTDDALRLMRTTTAFVTGLLVPGSMEALDLIRQARREFRRLPIVVVTALSAKMSEAEQAGANAVLLKPCLPDLLLNELQTRFV